MGSDIEYQYENRVINKTFEPLPILLTFFISIACLTGSILFYLYTRKKLSPSPIPQVPPQSQSKKDIVPTVKSDTGMKAQYSDDHLIVTSNMAERLKMFEQSQKVMH